MRTRPVSESSVNFGPNGAQLPLQKHLTQRKCHRETSQLTDRRQSHLFASTSYCQATTVLDQDEIMGELTLAAQSASVYDAERLINTMDRNGLEISVNAYHALIFAYAKAGNSMAAYKTLKLMLQAGIEPSAESYAVVIHTCMLTELQVKADEPLRLQNRVDALEEDEVLDMRVETALSLEPEADEASVSAASRVYDWLMTSSVDRQPGWACYLDGLLQQGLSEPDIGEQLKYMDLVEDHLKYGRREGWYADSAMYVDILTLLCGDPKKAVEAEQIMWEDLVTREGVVAEIEHWNCILKAEAVHTGINQARGTLIEMMEGKKGMHIRPNTASFNAMIEGCIMERVTGMSYAVEDFEETVAEMLIAGVKMDKRTHTMMMLFYILQQDKEKVVFEFSEAMKLAAPGRALDQLSDKWLELLGVFLLQEQCVLELLRVMLVLQSDSRPLPPLLCDVDENGHTISTRWLGPYLVGQMENRGHPELERFAATDEEEEEGQEIDDLYFSKDNIAVDKESGVPLAPKSMSLDSLRTELEVKGLSVEGNKTALTRRIKLSRGDQPMSIKEVILRSEAELQAKQVVQEEKESSSLLKKGQQLVVKYIETVDQDKISSRYYQMFIEDENDDEDGDEDFEKLHALQLPPDVEAQMKEYREAYNTRELETMYQLENEIWNTSDPEFIKLNPHFHGRPGFGRVLMWPIWGTGARLSLLMLETAESLGGSASLNDFFQINEACVQEGDDVTACALLRKLGSNIHLLEENDATWLCARTLLLCLQNNRMDSALSVAEFMEARRLEIPEEYFNQLPDVSEALTDDSPEEEPETENLSDKSETAGDQTQQYRNGFSVS